MKLRGLLYFLELQTEKKLECQYIIEEIGWSGTTLSYSRDRVLYEKRDLIYLRGTYQIATVTFREMTS